MEALTNVNQLRETFKKGIQQSGATLLQECSHSFSEEACTMVFLLSESHCSLHTYPEHGAVFIDLFTCGSSCDYKNFETVVKEYLQPTQVVSSVVDRGEKHVFL